MIIYIKSYFNTTKVVFLKDHHVSITTRNMNEYSEHVNQQSKKHFIIVSTAYIDCLYCLY